MKDHDEIIIFTKFHRIESFLLCEPFRSENVEAFSTTFSLFVDVSTSFLDQFTTRKSNRKRFGRWSKQSLVRHSFFVFFRREKMFDFLIFQVDSIRRTDQRMARNNSDIDRREKIIESRTFRSQNRCSSGSERH